ncbi:MAG: serine/threonine protein kinase, partial [Chloroflexi bacterium]
MTLPEDTILIERYRIDDLLAYGGRGAIYRAFDTSLNTPVAIKENFFQSPEAVAQFKKEALILARLRHPALPKVLHHFSFEGQQYLVMELVDGENLWQAVKRRGEPLPEREALDAMIQVCQAVNFLHRQSPPVLHRDIKPQNIKMSSDGRAKLVDVGIARRFANAQHQAEAGAVSATPGFSPPEQYTGEREASPASDIYSMGATLYALLTARRPPNSHSLLSGDATLTPPESINANISPPLARAILNAMRLKPEERPHSVLEWQKQLEA